MLPHPPPAAAGRRPSLEGIERVHRRPRGPRGRGRLAALVAAPLLVLGAAALLLHGRDASPVVLLGPLGLVLVQVGAHVGGRRAWTVLEDDGVRTSGGLGRARFHPWEDVSTVLVEGRSAVRSSLRLRDWAEVPLPHVPVAVAERLRDRIDAAPGPPRVRRASSAAAGRPHPDDLGLDGPFRRGPLRR